MKKISITFTLILSMILILSACQEGKQESQTSEPETEKLNDEVTPKTEKQNDEEKEGGNSEFHTDIPSATVQKISSDGLNSTLDNMYVEVCWNDCGANETFNYPDIHPGDVEVGYSILIDWRTMETTPTEVNLIQVSSSGDEISKKAINTDSSTLNIQVDEEEIGKQYAVQFLWKDDGKLKGHTVLNFKLS